jgi:crotonobetainyl-CoA:carnitine CoA-transferase CaiB-like acyl-CoA transferase
MARFSVTQGTLRRNAPLIGENTADVLAELEAIEHAQPDPPAKDTPAKETAR